MIQLGDNPEAQLLALVRTWFTHLARGEWDAALEMLDEPNCYGIQWTRELITSLLRDNFGPETSFAIRFGVPTFSDPRLAEGRATCSFGETDAGSFWLDHDVPLNGIFSDLTAQFEFHPRRDGFAVVLHDLHVM